MYQKKAISLLVTLVLTLWLAGISQAAVAFDMNLSAVDPGLEDVTGIESIYFHGVADLFSYPDETFSEDGTIDLLSYNEGQAFFDTGAQLLLTFSDLTGSTVTTDLGGGNTKITASFDPDQTILLSYVSNLMNVPIATLAVGPQSGGDVYTFQVGGDIVVNHQQTYYLTLDEEFVDVFDTPPDLVFVAELTAHNFDPGAPEQQYNMAGTVTAVPVPTSLLLIGSGFMGVLGLGRRKRNNG